MRGKQIVMDDFRGGVNTAAAPYDIGANQARDARNVFTDDSGAIVKRAGNTLFATAPETLTGIFGSPRVDPASDSSRYLLASSASALYAINTGGLIGTIASGLAAGSGRWDWIRAPAISGQGPFYGVNGAAAYQWSGATLVTPAAAWTATAGTVPVGKYMLYHGNRVWMAGMAADPSALQFSNIGDPRDWPPSNLVRFDPSDGEEITGIGVTGPYVLVFKKSKVWLVTDLDTGANRLISRNIGCVAHRSIAETPRGTLFLTDGKGVMLANQNNTQLLSNNERVSDPIIDNITAFTGPGASAHYFNDRYYLSMPNAAQLFDYDLRQGAWWIHTNPPTQMTVRPSTDGDDELFAATGPQVIQMFASGSTDLGVAYAAYWHGPFLTFGKPGIRKRCREIRVDGSGAVTISLMKDYATSAAVAGTGFPGGTVRSEAKIHTPGVARAWSMVFSNDTDAFLVESYTMAMQERTD